jgi:predicted phage terminase large subunit-like protein
MTRPTRQPPISEIDSGLLAATPALFAHSASNGNWQIARHLAALDDLLVDAAGGSRRLAVSLPPRHGKSKLISETLPAWYLGTFPERRVMLAAYEADFAATWGGRARDLLEREGHRFGIRVRGSSSARHRWDIEGHGGGMLSTGVGGPLTGSGANVLIIDDPIKNAEDAHSSTQRERLWDWYQSVAHPRLEPEATVIVVMTRWHEDDLIGRLEAEQPDAWRIVSFPAIAEAGDPLGRSVGEALWPERYPATALEDIRRSVGSYWWSAQYQQRPAPAGGGLFKREWVRTFTEHDNAYVFNEGLVEKGRCRIFTTVDLAVSTRTTADFTVIATWAVTPKSDLLLIDLDRRRLEAPDIVPALRAAFDRHAPIFIGVERTGFQLGIVQEARRSGLPVREMTADADKISRAYPAAARMEGGQVAWPAGAAWRFDVEAELLAFPRGRHDDIVDTLAYAVNQVASGHVGGSIHVSTPAALGRRLPTQTLGVYTSIAEGRRRQGHPPTVHWTSTQDSLPVAPASAAARR